ncbi:MAG: hypothetical protein CEE43_17155 [Promethearchaeota archaeon Loki_b32]|nr:MAG: hypothetical protein CEE43_17155 [Candidatus Lokiarchaeota archaeon Loki_b32]
MLKKLFTLRNTALIAFGLSGMSALIYEVAWSRLLSLIFGSTVYAVATMLCAFMAGLALGSYLMGRRVDKLKDLAKYFGLLELGIGIYGIMFIILLPYVQFPYFWLYQLLHSYFWPFLFAQFLFYFLILLIPTTMMGAIFPVVSKIFTRDLKKIGEDISYVYSANSLGSVLGPFLAGFILIPLIGLTKTVMVAATINILLALIMFRFSTFRSEIKFLLPIVLIFLVLGFYTSLPPILLNSWFMGTYESWDQVQDELSAIKPIFYKEGPYSTVVVAQTETGLGLKSDGHGEASTFPDDMRHQLIQAYIPMLLHHSPEKVLNIGMGAGFTLGAIGNFDVQKMDAIEIDPIIVDVSSKYFSEFNNDILKDPRVEVFVIDGRNYLLTTKEKYDVIISAPSHPVSTGVSHLFTKEFFELVKEHLNKDGMFLQWIPGHRFSPEEHKILVNTFNSVFPNISLWIDDIKALNENPNRSVETFLLGSFEPIEIDREQIKNKMASKEIIKKNLGGMGINSAEDFLFLMVMGDLQVQSFVQNEKRFNTDDKPIIEFLAPRSLLTMKFITLNDLYLF